MLQDNYICNKLGQHQSQTPVSSTFWFVDSDLTSNLFNLIYPNIFCAQKINEEKIWVQKDF